MLLAALAASSESDTQTYDSSRPETSGNRRPTTRGKTGDPFHDDPFFNPWAPGGTFNKNGRW